MVLACNALPDLSGEIETNYCGMHTRLGELIGKAVREVIREGVSGSISRYEQKGL